MTDQQPIAPGEGNSPSPPLGDSDTRQKWIVVSIDGAASGNVFHTRKDCSTLAHGAPGGELMEANHSTLRLLKMTRECKTCVRVNSLEADPRMGAVAEALMDVGYTARDDVPAGLSAAKAFRDALVARGYDIGKPSTR